MSSPATAPADGSPSAALGRQYEIAALLSMLDQAAAGSGSALLLRGEPGIGKTTLLDEAQRLAQQRGMTVLSGSGVRTETGLPFAGLHQLLRPVLPLVPGIPSQQAEPLRAALGLDERVLADLYRVALATLELLAVAAAQTPLLVVVDDVHWLDRPSADVLAFVGRRVAAEPIALLMSSRIDPGDPFEGSGLPALVVSALDPESSRSLLDRVAPCLASDVRDRLLTEAGGEPARPRRAAVRAPAGRRSARPPARRRSAQAVVHHTPVRAARHDADAAAGGFG